jgi:hypothetical protein
MPYPAGMSTGVPVLIHVTDPYDGLRTTPSYVVLSVNGGPMRSLRFGTNQLLLAPGRHHLHIALPLLKERGAQIAVDTSRLAPVQVYYAAPFSGFETGTVGFAPDPRAMRTRGRIRSLNKGLLVTLVVVVVAGALTVAGLFAWALYQAMTASPF